MATERFAARIAPRGLALVQDLVNTHATARGGQDLLIDRASAQEWLSGAARQWAQGRGLELPDLSLSEADVETLRDLRASVQEMCAQFPSLRPAGPGGEPGPGGQSGPGGPPGPGGTPVGVQKRAQVSLVSDDDGRVGIAPTGTGSSWLESAVWSEILLAQQSGEWSRLKLCREPGCRSAFYDTSRNGSGAWHNVRTCGNITNLRASRNRKKTRTTTEGSAPSAENLG